MITNLNRVLEDRYMMMLIESAVLQVLIFVVGIALFYAASKLEVDC